jgi:hypothetical protein
VSVRLPSKVSILGSDWTIETDRQGLDDDGRWGMTYPRTREIAVHLDADQPTVLVHELIHAIEESLKLEDQPLPEPTVHGIARGLVAALRDNPSLRRWFIAALES